MSLLEEYEVAVAGKKVTMISAKELWELMGSPEGFTISDYTWRITLPVAQAICRGAGIKLEVRISGGE